MARAGERASDGAQSPLFEPENSPPPPYRHPSVPVAAMVDPESAAMAPRESMTVDVSQFVQELNGMEETARNSFVEWDQSANASSNTSSSIPAKRKVSDCDSESDSDSDEDDADLVEPYDPSKQKRPSLPIYHPGFQTAEDLGRKILQILIAFLAAWILGGYEDGEAVLLKEETEKIQKPPKEPNVRVAITGDTGSGKSATLNSILGVDNLTPEGDNGGAVTNVVTEFRKKIQHKRGKPITAEVHFFCIEYCVNQVKNWFTVWYDLKHIDEEEIEENDKARKNAALECLVALFADRVIGPVESFLLKTKSATDTHILNRLVGWTRDLHAKFVKDGETSVEFEAVTHTDMREQLRPFRGTAQNAIYQGQRISCSPWPFVEIIRYYLDNAILEQGLCLADVPGTNDINIYRVALAFDYLQTCEMTLVIGDIKRVLSDAGFRKHFMSAHRRRYHGSVILCATRSDEMNDDGGSSLQLDTEGEAQLSPILRELEGLQSELNNIDQQVERNKAAIKRAQRQSEREYPEDQEVEPNASSRTLEELKEENKKFKARKKEIPMLIPPLEKQRWDIRLACRNRQVARGLDQRYRADTGDDGGAMSFCLSNRMFMRHVRGYNRKNADKSPTMSLVATQIPALCEYLYGIPSQGKVALVENFVTSTIPSFFDLMQMSCSRSTEVRVDHIISIVKGAIKQLGDLIDALATKCMETFVKELLDTLRDHELQKTFNTHATESLDNWGKNLAAATHKAVVRKSGVYVQKKKGGIKIDMNWNEKLLSPVRAEIERAFRIVLDESCPSFQGDAAQAIKKVLMELNLTLKYDPQALAGGAYSTCIGNCLKTHEGNITLHVRNASKKLHEGFNMIKQRATRAAEDDFFYDAMLNIYAESILQKAPKGKTLMFARHEYLKKHIIDEDGPFQRIAEWTQEDAEVVVEEMRKDLRKGVVSVFEKISSLFERQKNNKQNDSPEGQQFRKDLHLLVDEARKVLDGVVKESLERCKAHR